MRFSLASLQALSPAQKLRQFVIRSDSKEEIVVSYHSSVTIRSQVCRLYAKPAHSPIEVKVLITAAIYLQLIIVGIRKRHFNRAAAFFSSHLNNVETCYY